MTMELPICMSEEFWMNSQLSVARHYGGVRSGGKSWLVIGGSNDLVREDFLKYYRKLGRDRFLEVLRFYGPHNDDKKLKEYMELAVDDGRKESDVELNLVFDEEAL